MLTRIYLISLIFLVCHPAYSNGMAIGDIIPSPAKQACLEISNKLASVSLAECSQRNLQTSKSASFKQRPLLIKEYPPLLNKRKPQAKVLLLGGIHGDEYSSVTIMFKWLHILDKYHSGLFHWKVAPLVNPDGLLQKKSRRVNANGVDLNRNFPNNDKPHASLEYWKQKAYSDSRRYPGPSPTSEPETQWIVKLIEEFQPDVIVAVHAPFGIVDFDGPPKPPAHLGSLHLKLLGTYPGSLGNYAGLQQQIPVVTVELPHAGIMPSDWEVNRIWIDLIKWLRSHTPQKTPQP